MNERQMNVAKLIFMMYELIEENVFDVEKSIKKSTSSILEIDSINEKSSEKSDIEQFINLIIIMKRIKKQRISKTKFFNNSWTSNESTNARYFLHSTKKISNWNWITAKFKMICFESKIVCMFQQTKFCKSTSSKSHMNQNQSIMQNDQRHMTESIVIIIDLKCMFQYNNTSKHVMHAKKLNTIAMQNRNCLILYRYRRITFRTYRSTLLHFYRYANVMN